MPPQPGDYAKVSPYDSDVTWGQLFGRDTPPPPAPPQAPVIDAKLEADIKEWQQLKEWLTTGKAKEMELRQSIAARMFNNVRQPNGTFPEGTTHGEVETPGARWHGTLGGKLDRQVLEELVIPTLAEAQLTPEEQKALVKMNPVLSVKAYKALPEAKRLIVDKMLVIKQGAITLEINQLPKL